MSVLAPGGTGGRRLKSDPNQWHLDGSDDEETSDEEWEPTDECVPGLASDVNTRGNHMITP